jgi:hypothetical protein
MKSKIVLILVFFLTPLSSARGDEQLPSNADAYTVHKWLNSDNQAQVKAAQDHLVEEMKDPNVLKSWQETHAYLRAINSKDVARIGEMIRRAEFNGKNGKANHLSWKDAKVYLLKALFKSLEWKSYVAAADTLSSEFTREESIKILELIDRLNPPPNLDLLERDTLEFHADRQKNFRELVEIFDSLFKNKKKFQLVPENKQPNPTKYYYFAGLHYSSCDLKEPESCPLVSVTFLLNYEGQLYSLYLSDSGTISFASIDKARQFNRSIGIRPSDDLPPGAILPNGSKASQMTHSFEVSLPGIIWRPSLTSAPYDLTGMWLSESQIEDGITESFFPKQRLDRTEYRFETPSSLEFRERIKQDWKLDDADIAGLSTAPSNRIIPEK